LKIDTGHALPMALVYRDLARRIQTAPVNLINIPGFFFIKILYRNQLFFLDPCQEGKILSISDLQKKISYRFDKNITLNSAFLETPN